VNVSLIPTENPEHANVDVPLADYWASRQLLPAGDRLWVYSKDAIGYFKDNKLTLTGECLSNIVSRAFMYRGFPSVIEGTPGGETLESFSQGRWMRIARLALKAGLPAGVDIEWMEVVPVGDTLHLFQNDNNRILHAAVHPDAEGGSIALWTPVPVRSTEGLAVSRLDGRPAMFVLARDKGVDRIVGWTLSSAGWQEFVSYATPHGVSALSTRVRAAVAERDDAVFLFYMDKGGACQLLQIDKRGIKESRSWVPRGTGGLFHRPRSK